MRAFVPTAAMACAALLISSPDVCAGSWEAIEHLAGQLPVNVKVNEQIRAYFRIVPDRPLTVTLEGPGRLRVISRVELPPGSKDIVSYGLRATEGSTVLDQQKTETSAASQASIEGDSHAVGKSRRMDVDIPRGTHRIALVVDGAATVLVRLQQAAPALGEQPMVTLTPVEAARSVLVTEGEKTIPYYSVMPDQPVKLRVVGPTALDLLARLDFDETMRGTQSYRLVIREKGKVLRDVEFKTTKATTAAYANLKDRVPSKFDRLQLAIGDGLHELSIELGAPARGVAEIHARIPEPTVGGRE